MSGWALRVGRLEFADFLERRDVGGDERRLLADGHAQGGGGRAAGGEDARSVGEHGHGWRSESLAVERGNGDAGGSSVVSLPVRRPQRPSRPVT